MLKELEKKYQTLVQPSDELVSDIGKLNGDILILGAGGKMGPALSRLVKQAVDKAGANKKIVAVARFSEPGLQDQLRHEGIETIAIDLLDDVKLQALPEVDNVLYLAGTKFGTRNNEPLTWAMNAYLPGRVAQKFKHSRIVVFSTGNVYPFTKDGATEVLPPEPIGEYGQSCLGRERVFQYFALQNNTPTLIYRLNYANDVTYGVLLDIATSVKNKKPIDLSMGSVNVIWQGDANDIAIRSLHHCSVPSKILNVTGPEILSVRWVAEQFGGMIGATPEFINEEQPTSLLSNASESMRLFGRPKVSLKQMMEIILEWLEAGGKTWNKPTHFSERKGKF